MLHATHWSVGVAGNTPPTLTMERDWHLQESEAVGTVVTRVRSQDSEGDRVVYAITKSTVGEDGSHLFAIDENGVVTLAKSLQGLVSGIPP